MKGMIDPSTSSLVLICSPQKALSNSYSLFSHRLVELLRRFGLEADLYSLVYRELRRIDKNHGLRIATNNYGYYPTTIDAEDKYQLQMYDECVGLMLKERIEDALEIGSGAGGGLIHLRSRLPEVRFSGVDRCKEAIKTCRYFLGAQHQDIELHTNIEKLVSDGRTFDAVMSVETSIATCDTDIFGTLRTLLKKDGVLICYDNTSVKRLEIVTRRIEGHGFAIELFRDITENVFTACELDTARRLRIVDTYLPMYLRPFRRKLLWYMCTKDSPRYVKFAKGKKRSFLLKARKTAC